MKVVKGLEQRRDINKSLYKNEASSSSDPRKAGKLITWISNVDAPSDMAAAANGNGDRKSTRLNSSHMSESRMPSSA